MGKKPGQLSKWEVILYLGGTLLFVGFLFKSVNKGDSTAESERKMQRMAEVEVEFYLT